MEDKTLLNKARATNKRFHDFKKYMMDLTRISNDLNNEIIIDNEKLKTLYAEINSLQNKITVLDEKKCKLETGVDELTIKMKNYELLKIHLAALNQRKQIFEDHTIEEGFKEQGKNVKT
ncbi:uncharacterized protein LOC112684238 [Sipha flava]|uniref:Uncharacterized protein LOC112684238 n=1 Tax=Sipha flava TaxID=143950 RepID=A0A8B8FLB3_9HEMI|nr:uncharacterized protein LOC112684238 [Sipha flava]